MPCVLVKRSSSGVYMMWLNGAQIYGSVDATLADMFFSLHCSPAVAAEADGKKNRLVCLTDKPVFIVLFDLCAVKRGADYSATAAAASSTTAALSGATESATSATSTTSSTTAAVSTASAASAFSALLPQEIMERPAITAKDRNNFFIFVFRLNNKTIFCASKTLQRYD